MASMLIASKAGKTCMVIAGNPNFSSTNAGVTWEYMSDENSALLEEPTFEQLKEFLANSSASLVDAGHSISKFEKTDFTPSDY